MATTQPSSEIEDRLQAFINSTPSQLSVPEESDEPLVILYPRNTLGSSSPELHPLLLPFTASRAHVTFEEAGDLRDKTLENRILFQINVYDCTLRNCTLILCAVYGGEFEAYSFQFTETKFSERRGSNHGSTMRNCTLMSSGIQRGRFEACRFQDCHFAEKEVPKRGHGADLAKTHVISDSEIDGGTICAADISKSTLRSIGRLRNCLLKDSLMINSMARVSLFTNCGLHNSALYNSPTQHGAQTDSVISSQTTLRILPVEIRKMIYDYVLEVDDAAVTLMAGFQPDSLLYGEVLEACFREETFVISEENLESFRAAPKEVRRRMTKIRLKGPKAVSTADPAKYFPTGTKVTDITLEFASGLYVNLNVQAFYDVCRLWFKHFLTVKTFTVIWTNIGPRYNNFQAGAPTALNGAVRTANVWIKRQADAERIIGDQNQTLTWTWTWTAEEDGVLAWHSCLLDHQP